MIQRCYSEKALIKFPNYRGCTVCEEWHNFQVFGKWFDENYYKVGNERIHLDKDILHKGNKIYSPNTCIFAPERINILFTKNNAKRGALPIGVNWHIRDNIYEIHMNVCENKKKTSKYLGRSNNVIEAFNLYKLKKEMYIRKVADNYKNNIPMKLYDAMYNYVVEIND